MNAFLELLAEPLGWTLLHFCWQAAGIALVYWAVDRVIDLRLPPRRSQVRYLVSLAAILSMFAVSLATLGYEIERNQVGNQADGSVVSSFIGTLPAAWAPVPSGALQASSPRHAGLDLSAVLPWLDAVWLLGVLGLSTRTVGGWWWIERLRRRALVEAPGSVFARLARVRERLGIRRRVDLRISGQIPGPMAIGVLRSLILLPAGALLALDPEQMEAVLAHELAHVRRADYLWNLVQTTIETLFFFHPAVWWMGARLREQRELCCDDIAVGFCPDPLVYATALLSMEEQRNRKLDLAMALNGQSRSGLRLRIARMLGEASPSENGRGLTPLPLAVFCAGVVILLLPTGRVFAGPQSHEMQMRAQPQAAIPAQPPPAPPSVAAPVQPPVPQADPKPGVPATAAQPAPHANPEPLLPLSPADSNTAALRSLTRLSATVDAQTETARAMSVFATAHDIGPSAAQNALPAAGSDYIGKMRAAGYDLPPEKYMNLKVLGVTPEYAREMQKLGFGKPSLGDLIAMEVQGVTPQYIEQMRAAGFEPHSFHEIIAYRTFNVSPEYLASIKGAGFASASTKELVQLRILGVTPEYAAKMKKQFPNITVGELIQLRIFKINDAFIADAKRHNFAPITVQKLVRLRISGVLNDSVTEPDKGKE